MNSTTGEQIPAKEQHPHGGDWLREIVFGLNDGLVTTLVFIMALTTATHDPLILIVLGQVLAGGISMALGGYISARTNQEVLEQRIATERFEVQHEPDEERAELRALYEQKGFTGDLLERIIDHLTANEERWLHALVLDELGIVDEHKIVPWRQGAQIGISFVIGGLIPAVPVVLALPQMGWWAYALTGLAALALGAVKAQYTGKGPLRSGLEFLGIVTVGTLAGVGLGLLLHIS
ncbi:MAG TPA: VIT1/CCC1 transporter family protein [Chloroflexia bacterium]|nr:VIT1/CCC1 transporter family protein [Chloroflexia bacterium]